MINENIFDYTKANKPEDCKVSISPSQISKFFDYPKIWYQENILGQEQAFKGNTASFIGTIVHYLCKHTTLTPNESINRDDINEQLYKELTENPNENVDIAEVINLYPEVAKVVMNEYVIPNNNKGCKILAEQQIVSKFMNNVYIVGTFDRLEGDCLVDYKNVSIKPNENQIPFGYKIQLLTYAMALREQGHEVNRIRLVYGVRPTKTLPARCIVVTEDIDYIAEKLVNDTLKLMSESCLTVLEKPELAYMIFKSYDLKLK